MNKLTLYKGKAMACLILLCFLAQSCRKDSLIPNSNDIQNGISITEAKKYFEKNIHNAKPERLMSTSGTNRDISVESVLAGKQPVWSSAYEKVLTTGMGVKVPIDFGNAYSIINPKTKDAVPLSSLNYLFIYKDSLQTIHAEWVILEPDSAWLYGNRSQYLGRIYVKDWNGKTIRNFGYNQQGLVNPISIINKQKLSSAGKLQTTNGEDESGLIGPQRYCIRVSTGRCPQKLPRCDQNYCDMCLELCAKEYCNWMPTCTGPECQLPGGNNGGGSPSNPGGSGPRTPGGGGAYPPDDCGGGTVIPRQGGNTDLNSIPLPPCVPKPKLLEAIFINLSIEQSNFISNNPDIENALGEYLRDASDKTEAQEFYQWSVDYLMENTNDFLSFKNVFLSGPHDLIFEAVEIENNGTNILSASDYNVAGLSDYFTESEFENVVQNLSNDVTEDPIQLYLIACYKNSKLFNSSMYSKPNNFQVGEYTLCPHYNSQNKLVFYSAFRKSTLGIEYLIRADALNAFKKNYTLYKSYANLFYVNGIPSYWQVQMGAGDYWNGLAESYKEAFSNPYYYLYLGHIFVGTATNLNNVPANNPVKITVSPVNDPIKWTSSTIRNTDIVSVTIENRTIAQYRDMISQKHNTSWQSIGEGKFKLEAGQNRYISYPVATSTKGPTIEYFRNGKSIGKFRFHN